jgi:ABC-2 type transport system ATP-binding protein
MNLIETQELSKFYGKHAVLNGLNLQVGEGQIYALVGSNGAGKSTTIQILTNIQQASDGRATVLGRDSRQLGPKEFAQIGYVSENQEVIGEFTVAQMLAYWKPFYPTWDDALASHLLDALRLPGDRKLKHLSKGMRVKAQLLSSLAYRPKLMVLDEPFNGLDPLARDEFIETLLEVASETTIFISSHDLNEIESFATHVGFLEEGRMLFSESIEGLQSRFREVDVVFGSDARLPQQIPVNWLQAATQGAVARLVHDRYRQGETETEILRCLGVDGANKVQVRSMSLRNIFLALTKSKVGQKKEAE